MTFDASVSSFGSIGPSPSSAGKTHGLRTAMRFRRLNCSTAGGVSGTAKATPFLVRSAGISQTGALVSRSNSDQRAAASSDRLTAVRRISWIAIPVCLARFWELSGNWSANASTRRELKFSSNNSFKTPQAVHLSAVHVPRQHQARPKVS